MESYKLKFFSVAEIKPEGWLRRQLEIQAEGLSGRLPEFWPDIKDSSWIGGRKDGWERVPYWLDGYVILAFQLDDERMKNTAKRYIDSIIKAQQEDGWICPTDDRDQYDMWAYILILKTLVAYHRASGDDSVEQPVYKALKCLDRHIERIPLRDWGQTRWFEALIPIYWLYERLHEDWLIKLAVKLRVTGSDWKALFETDYPYSEATEKDMWGQFSHVVNNAMMLKGSALYSLISERSDDYDFAESAYQTLMKHHGTATGAISGDECLSGTNPFQGTELCSVSELMYSCEHLAAHTANPVWGDRLESLAFNAFPATFTPDMNNHQYDQQVNQPYALYNPEHQYNTNGPESNLFGVEPNYGCCTANMHQGWPKFAASLFMKPQNGVSVMCYSPATLDTTINSSHVVIKMDTRYPFGDTISFTVECDKPVHFNLSLRIPDWCSQPACDSAGSFSNGFYNINQEWSGIKTLCLRLPMSARLENRPENCMVLKRGPLLYSLRIKERYVKQEKPGEDWWLENFELYNESRWEYVFSIKDVSALEFIEHDIGKYPFNPGTPPVTVKVPCRKVEWPVKGLVPDRIPDLRTISDKTEDLVFVPYGCTMLRMTELPNCIPSE